MMKANRQLLNYADGAFQRSDSTEFLEVKNPATSEIVAHVPVSNQRDVDGVVQAAKAAFPGWRRTPPSDRSQYLFKLKGLLEEHFEEISRTTTQECGKTLIEAKGELRRGIENVEVASGIPVLMMGYNSEDIARGIDEAMFRQPVGVMAAITPFNFPAMIPLWFLPYAIACGNTFILKPSEKVPLTMNLIFRLIDQLELPPGVVNLIHGDGQTVDALLDHPTVRGISFVGSSPVARYVYGRAATNGKRVQCQGGAKNAIVVLPDADLRMATQMVAESAFGCAGQRCLAASVAIAVGRVHKSFGEQIAEAATSRRVGYGLDSGIEMGPVITLESKLRIQKEISQAESQGAGLVVDGRDPSISGYSHGNFVRPTVLDEVEPSSPIAQTEVFGPVLSLMRAQTIEDAIAMVNNLPYGNMACLFTGSGAAARKFRYEVQVGNVGINVGVAAPIAFFPFSGWKESFFGDLHGQGRDAIDFYTEKKISIERWFAEPG